MTQTLKTPEFLQFQAGSAVHYGFDQDWYRGFWQRKAGCGPCTGSHILYYLSQAGRLTLPMQVRDRDSFINLMEHSWGYLTPGVMGLNSPFMMQEGLDTMLAELGTGYRSLVLEVPSDAAHRPSVAVAEAFIRAGLAADSPVAFLNLHNGGIHQLETWHWVTVIGLSGTGEQAAMEIYDNGNHLRVSLPDWLAHTKRGGGFVYVKEEQAGAA